MGYETPGTVTTVNEYVYGPVALYNGGMTWWGIIWMGNIVSSGTYDRITTLTCGEGKLRMTKEVL